ncbi:MAG: hypothetical protein IMZ61_04035 [Planctomycetes bacterium]|nr:hypothetical protein [Planctomycetota bacterium]
MDIDNLVKALDGDRNAVLKGVLKDLIYTGFVENDDGKIRLNVTLMSDQKGPAYALANWDDYETTSALITHDLRSFECRDLGTLISKLRIA